MSDWTWGPQQGTEGTSPEFALRTGLRWQVRKDDTPFRAALFENLIQEKRLVARGYAFASRWSRGRLGGLSCWQYFLFVYLSIRLPEPSKVITAYRIKNEETSFLDVIRQEKQRDIGIVRFHPLAGLSHEALKPDQRMLHHTLRFRRTMRWLSRQYPLYVALRAAEYLAYYSRAYSLVADNRVRTVLAFSDGNPHGIALLQLARRHGKAAVFVAHGEPTGPTLPLICKAAFLWGPDSYEQYRNAGASIDQPLFRGCKDEWRPMTVLRKPMACVGVFLGKTTHEANIVALLGQLRLQYKPREILVRPHPNAPLPPSTVRELTRDPSVRVSESPELSRDVHSSDLVLAGNTTAHPEILLGGTPSLYCYELEDGEFDRNGYLKGGLVLRWNPGIELSAINDFYQSPRLAAHLHGHFDLDHTREASLEQFNAIVFED